MRAARRVGVSDATSSDGEKAVTWPRDQAKLDRVRALMAELGLQSWVKTSGSKGFHILVPLDGKADFNEVAAFTDAAGKQTKTVVGKAFESEFKQAKELVGNCKEDLACYHAKLTDEKTQGKDQQFTGIKAAYMIGILGGDADRKKLVDDVPKNDRGKVDKKALKTREASGENPRGD